MTEIFELSLTRLDKGLRKREFSLVEVMESLASRIELRESETRAFTSLNLGRVRAQLDQVQSQPRETAISGIPFGVKDIFNTSEWVTSYGSKIYKGHQPVSDAAIVSQLRAAGGVVMGKTVTTEFAYFFPGKTRNPKDLGHTPGGSSQGSAAAVADWMIPFALGSQTAASVIRPAAFCGVIGYKASVGQFPLNGVLTLSYSMDSLGFFVRDVKDLQLLRGILLNQSSSPAPVKPRRVGLVATPQWCTLDEASQSIIEGVIKNLGAAGVEVGEVEVDGYQGIDLIKAHKTVMAYEASRARAVEFERHSADLSEQFCELMQEGRLINYEQCQEALAQRDSANQRLMETWRNYDLLLTPSALGEAPQGLSSTGDPIFSRAWNLLGGPAITLPAGVGQKKLPLGIQLIGPVASDDYLIAQALWFDQNALPSTTG